MMQAGEIAIIQYPFADLSQAKLRPALLLGRLPGKHDDWLVCMISSRVRQHTKGFDDLIDMGDADFVQSGLKSTSVIRVGRLLIVEGKLLPGPLVQLAPNDCSEFAANWLLGCCGPNSHLKLDGEP